MWKFVSTPCITAAIRSRPMPVSMFLLGSGRRLFGRIADAVELREDQVPDLDFACRLVGWKKISLHGPQTPSGPLLGAPAGQKLSSSPIRWMRSGGSLISSCQMSAASSSSMIDGDAQPRGIERQPLLAGQKLPGPVDRFALEVVAEAEVAQHLEERVVIGRAADVVDVAGAQALLAGRGARELQLALAEEVVLELVHARRA